MNLLHRWLPALGGGRAAGAVSGHAVDGSSGGGADNRAGVVFGMSRRCRRRDTVGGRGGCWDPAMRYHNGMDADEGARSGVDVRPGGRGAVWDAAVGVCSGCDPRDLDTGGRATASSSNRAWFGGGEQRCGAELGSETSEE